MNARDEILARLRGRQRDELHPPAWRSRRHFPDLAGQFSEALTAAQGEVIRAANWEAALDRLAILLREKGASRVVANDEPPLNQVDLAGRLPQIEWHVVGHSTGDLRPFCASADAGLSSADVALAETGTIVLTSGPGRSRLTTLLPPIHVALVPTARLTADIFTWTAARRGPPPAAVTLVSGPSKTADIEQTLAVGVHGPKQFIVILFEG
jgi:L-lactate dehydrogenase complex protein LldG